MTAPEPEPTAAVEPEILTWRDVARAYPAHTWEIVEFGDQNDDWSEYGLVYVSLRRRAAARP